MSDNLGKKDYRDKSRINMNESYEVQYWTKKWNITAQQLSGAIRAVGSTSARKVEEYLRSKNKI